MSAAPYEPGEDTFLLLRGVRAFRVGLALEIGVGVGAVTEALAQMADQVVGTDTQRMALQATRNRLRARSTERVELVHASGASPFREGTFDLVAFNPPYLPAGRTHDPAVDGGPGGIQVTLEALSDIARTLRPQGRLLLVASSHTNVRALLGGLSKQGLEVQRMQSKKLFFEELYLFEAIRR